MQRACDRCRIKKSKCDGDTPCLRCSQDDAPCIVSKKAHTDSQSRLGEYVQSIESQQTSLVRALQKCHLHSRKCIDQEDMKEIVEIVRRCGYDFTELPEQSGKPQTVAGMVPSRTYSTVCGDASKGANLDDLSGAQTFPPTTLDDHGAHITPNKRRKRGLESDANDSLVSRYTGSVVDIDMHGRSLGGPSELQMPSSARIDTTPPSVKSADHIDPLTNGAEIDNFSDQFMQIDTWSDVDFELSGKPTSPDPSSVAPSELQISSMSTPNASSPAPAPTGFDTQITDLNHTDLSLSPCPATTDATDLQALFDLDSTVWWDPSLLFDTDIDNVGHGDLAT